MSALTRGITAVAVFLLILLATGFMHAGELRVLNDIRRRVLRGRTAPSPPPGDDSEQVEMAGEIVATTHEPQEKP